MTSEAQRVWERIVDAFPPFLPAQPVTVCDCEECRDVRADLGHVRWDDVLPPAVEKHFGSLPLLTDDAFHALLPAFLFHAIGDISRENRILEFTLYALCGPYEESHAAIDASDEKGRRRVRKYDESQRDAVRAFLALAAAAPELEFHHSAIAHALEVIWR